MHALHILHIILDSPVYWYLTGMIWALPVYFIGKIKGFKAAKDIYEPLLDRSLEFNTDSVKLLCQVRDGMKKNGIFHYLPEDNQSDKPTEH